ncbi:MAG: PEP-CTERM sorting domain-containing protein, partial [Akkermansiaceae bacterium]
FATDTTTIGGILRATDCCNFQGSIDDVSFWDQDLSASQISALAGGASATSVAIPEPSSALLTLGGLLLAIRRRR